MYRACLGCLIAAVCMADTAPFTQNSTPAGIVSATARPELGSYVATVEAPFITGDYSFAYWTLNGVRQSDVFGRALNPVRFLILEPSTATAYYLATTQDANANGVPDWFELRFHAALTNGASDADADGFSLREEYWRDYAPNHADRMAAGGVSLTCSPTVLAIPDTNYVAMTVATTPAELRRLTVVTNRGARVSIDDAYGPTNCFRFAYWTLDGTVQTDMTGRAVGFFDFDLLRHATVRGLYIDEDDDLNANGIADWYEQHYLPTRAAGPADDADGDGFCLLEEFHRDWHPGVADVLTDGGVTLDLAPAQMAVCDPRYATYTRYSTPFGFVPSLAVVTNRGALIAVPDAPTPVDEYRFAYWTLNGAPRTDLTGRAMGRFEFELQSNVVARAHYIPEDLDEDGDGVPDWYEQSFYGTLALKDTADTDGDGLGMAEEYRRACHPRMEDVLREGGICMDMAPTTQAITDTNLASFALYTTPAGFVSLGYVTNIGATISVPDSFGARDGHRFAYWTLNGSVQRDLTGRARSGFSFTLTESSVGQGLFLDADRDDDGDRIADWYEAHFYATANPPPDDDSDGDGLGLREEYCRDYHPGLRDVLRPGGITLRLAERTEVSFGFFLRVTSTMLNGQHTDAFSRSTSATGTLAVAANSHPALGDWDGDGDLDLFVGGAGGVMRIFENAGSPRVLNLVERTANFTSLAFAWTNAVNPSPALGDWSGDGKADLAVGDGTGGVWLVESSGTFDEVGGTGVRVQESTSNAQQPTPNDQVGSALPLALALRSLGEAGLDVQPSLLNVGVPGAIPAFADINRDGWVDLLVLTDAGQVQCHTHTGAPAAPYDGTPSTPDLLGTAVPNARGLTTADVNGDGVTDVLVSDDNGNIWEFHGAGGAP